MEITKISEEIHANAISKGFWEPGWNLSEKLMLIVSEIAEAQEADRKDHFSKEKTLETFWSFYSRAYNIDKDGSIEDAMKYFEENIKNTFEDELADAAIRIFDLAHKKGIDLAAHIRVKHWYNTQRPYKHGKKY